MMAASTHFKLGLLALLTLLALGIAAFTLAIRRQPAHIYHTYFDESVQGLDKGAMVKFRGVRIGKVSSVAIAADNRLVDVELAIDQGAINVARLSPGLRAQLVSYGITGVKLIDLDIQRPDTPPPPTLAFIPPKNYIPSRPSLLDSLSQRLDVISAKLVTLVDRSIVAADAARDLFSTANRAARDVSVLTRHIDSTTGKVDKLLGSVRETADSTRSLVRTTNDAAADLQQSLRVVRDAARSVGLFFNALERQPDMIIKGRRGR